MNNIKEKKNEHSLAVKKFDVPLQKPERRTAFSKVYQTGPNTYQAVTYANEVHTWDAEKKEYREIDNTFSEKNGILENKDNPNLKVRLLAERVQLQSAAGHKLRWKFDDIGMGSAAAVRPADIRAERDARMAQAKCNDEPVLPMKETVEEIQDKAFKNAATQKETPVRFASSAPRSEKAVMLSATDNSSANQAKYSASDPLSADTCMAGEELANALGVDLAVMEGLAEEHLAAQQTTAPENDAHSTMLEQMPCIADDDNDKAVTEAQRQDMAAKQAASFVPENKSIGIARYHINEPGIHLYCMAAGSGFKDEIIFDNRTAARDMTLTLEAEGLTAVQEGRVISFVNQDGEEEFTLPAPIAWDSQIGPEPVDVDVRMEQVSDTVYQVKYLLDEAWLDQAVYPVTLDPAVVTPNSLIASEDAYTTSKYPDETHPGNKDYKLRMSLNSSNWGQSNVYIRFGESVLPTLDSSDYISNALLSVFSYGGNSYPTSAFDAAVYEVTSAWDKNTLTWNNAPTNDAFVHDFTHFNQGEATGHRHIFDITNMVRHWYNGSNYGLVIKAIQSTFAMICSAAVTSIADAVLRPMVIINYTSKAGLESYLAYDEQDIGRAGIGHVSLFNGNLIFTHQDTAGKGQRMPVSVAHIYNSCRANSNAHGIGMGWQTNYDQSLRMISKDASISESGAVNRYLIWQDEDGTDHYFDYTNGVWKDMEGLEMTLTIASGYVDVVDKAGMIRRFNASVNLSNSSMSPVPLAQVIDAMGNAIQITIANGKIQKVTDGVGRETVFSWNSNGTLRAIIPPHEASNTTPAEIAYTYDGNNRLTAITHEDGNQSLYSYSDQGLLVSVTQAGGRMMTYGYTLTAPYRVSLAYSFGLVGNPGEAMSVQTFYYHSYNYLDCLTAVADSLIGKQIFYRFNDAGNLLSVTDELGYSAFAQYTPGGSLYQPQIISRLQKTVRNLIQDPLFERATTGWIHGNAGSDGLFLKDTNVHYVGSQSQLIYKSNAAGNLHIVQQVPLTPGKTYTFSAHILTLGTQAQLMISNHYANGTSSLIGSSIESTPGTWQRINWTFTADASATMFQAFVVVFGTGHCWVDAVQLEEGIVANRLNLVDNGAFDGGLAGWSKSACTDLDTVVNNIWSLHPEDLGDNVLRVYGGWSNSSKRVYQILPISGNQGDTYTIGGWASTGTVPRMDKTTGQEIDDRLCVRAIFCDANNNWAYGGTAKWCEEWSGWHMAAAPVVAPFNYTQIMIAVDFMNNANYAIFDGIFLHKEEFGQSYEWDSANGNLLSTTDLAKLKDGAVYDAFNNMTEYHQAGRDASIKTVMTYGSSDAEKKQHLLRTVTTPLGTRTSYTYDAYGNPLTTTVTDQTETPKIVSGTTYTADGNYVSKQKDARGYEVTTVTDPVTGNVQSVTDPLGQTVEYSYDIMNRVTETRATVGTKVYKNQYQYEYDRLTEVRHNTSANTANDVVYRFEYDSFVRPNKVKVGTQTLSETSYNDSGTVAQVAYGNGGRVNYTYDGFKRLTGVGFDGAGQRFAYVYGANGEVFQVTDNVRGARVRSSYDLANRPMRKETLLSGTHAYTGEVAYDNLGNLSAFKEYVGAGKTSFITNYSYDNENRLIGESFSHGGSIGYNYAQIGRLNSKEVNTGSTTINTGYTYLGASSPALGNTTLLVQTITQNGETLEYTYDAVGNIKSVKVTSGGVAKTVTYVYDKLGQLTRCNDPMDTTAGSTGTTWVYAYDLGGNILSKKAYAYTTGSLSGASAVQTIPYVYANANWKDLLTSFNGQTITYDAIGNPLSDGTWSYTWQHGRQLASMAKSGETVSFVYNEDGLRVQKISTTKGTTNYTLHGKNVVHMTNSANGIDMHFFYDAQNRPAIVIYNGTAYYYMHNLQGDIIHLVDANGNNVVNYVYDAWGKKLSVTGSMAGSLGYWQPFRYRGYVYDEETGLYYLRSRYYSTTISRFINEDDRLVISFKGSNLYIYTNNNPIAHRDESGHDAVSIDMIYMNSIETGPIGWLLAACTIALIVISQDIFSQDKLPSASSYKAMSMPDNSDDIDWHHSDHWWKGSQNHGGHNWGKLKPPKDPNDAWNYLLPLMKRVIDEADRISPIATNRRDTAIYIFEKYFPEYDASISVQIFQSLDGTNHFSNAWTH